MKLHAVITADIVNSTKLRPKDEKKLIDMLKRLLEPNKHEFYRGDSFQVYVKEADKALSIALLCRATAIGASQSSECDIRISIGLGSVTSPVRSLATAKGDAFITSGRAFDEFSKENKRLVIKVAGKDNGAFGIGFDLIADHVDSIFIGMTAKQAEVITEMLKGETQQEAAEKFKKSKSTVSQLVSSARWTEVEKLCRQYKNLVKLIQ